MRPDQINKGLQQKELPDWHSDLLNTTRDLVDMSRRTMSKQYGRWDANNDVYRGYRQPDDKDKKAKERGEPEKMIVPVTYSQAQTFAAFVFALFTQRDTMFELTGQNPSSHKAAKIGEALLQRDLVYNIFEAKLYQLLIDVARYGVAVTKTYWCKETQRVREPVTIPGKSFMGVQLTQDQVEWQEKEVTKFLGNKIMSVSPYRFYPDTRLPITRFQDGEFVASEDEYSMQQLYTLQAQGVVFGVEHIVNMDKDRWDKRGTGRLSDGFTPLDTQKTSQAAKQSGTVVITEVQRIINPSKFMVAGKPLDAAVDRQVKYLVWYANDSRVIRFEPLNYLHDQFTYDVALYSPDQQDETPVSLADTIDMLQSTMTWFINARITSVRKVIQNYLVVDPEGVDIQDVLKRNPIIRLKPGAGQRGIDRWIKQLNVTDVTTNHLQDAKFLEELIQLTSGINDNMMGQFNGGRRSAQEARNVFTSAASRLKMIATLIFRMCLEQMGRKMLSNLRDGLDEQTMVKLVGIDDTVNGGFVGVSKSDLVGSYDFEVFDGTLPSEKGVKADIFAQIVQEFIKAPEQSLAIGIDPKACFIELLELRGVKNPERFMLQAPPPGAVPGQPGAPAAAPTQPAPAGTPFPMLGQGGQQGY
jgi:hypothetical protein